MCPVKMIKRKTLFIWLYRWLRHIAIHCQKFIVYKTCLSFIEDISDIQSSSEFGLKSGSVSEDGSKKRVGSGSHMGTWWISSPVVKTFPLPTHISLFLYDPLQCLCCTVLRMMSFSALSLFQLESLQLSENDNSLVNTNTETNRKMYMIDVQCIKCWLKYLCLLFSALFGISSIFSAHFCQKIEYQHFVTKMKYIDQCHMLWLGIWAVCRCFF